MMNEYYGHTRGMGGRGGRDHGSMNRAPYRRPMGRGSMPTYPSARSGGCGCGLSGRMEQTPPRRICPDPPAKAEPCAAVPVLNGSGCGCGCDHGQDRSACRKLLEQIRAVDFALYETVLYLDVYPHSCDALETYHKLKAQQTELHKEYEALCGPLTAFGNESRTSWDWMNKPFPWEYDAD